MFFFGNINLFQMFFLTFFSQSSQLSFFDASENLNILSQALTPELQGCVKVIITDKTKNFPVGNINFDDKYVLTFENSTRSSILNQKTQICNLHKLRNTCTLAIVEVSNQAISSGQSMSQNLEIFYNFLKSLDGMIRNDRDNFIFYSIIKKSQSELKFNSLLRSTFTSGPIASYVKNKVGLQIFLQNSNNTPTISILTTCFYCGPDNTPKLLETDYLTKLEPIQFPDYLNSFHGKELTVSVATLCHWNIGLEPIPGKPGKYKAIRGIYKFNFDHLSEKFNFTGTFFPSTGGGGTGNRFANGTWAGAAGDVYNGKADLGGPVGIVLNRALIVNFAFPVTYDSIVFTTGIPQPFYSWRAIYWPLDSLIWYLSFGFTVLTSCSFVLFWKISRNRKYPISRVSRYLFALFLEQDDAKVEISDHSSRVLLTFWLIFCILITTAYRSKLITLISFPILEDPPNSFKSLAQTPVNGFEITLQYLRGAAYAVLRTSKNPTFMNIFSRMKLEENDALCFQKSIGTIKHACISWATVATYVKYKNLSDSSGYAPLVTAKDTSLFIAASFAFRKEEVFKEKFDVVISKATEMGLKEKWMDLDNEWVRMERHKWEKRDNITKVVYEDSVGGSKPLIIENLMGTFFVLVGGFILGWLGLLGEIILCKIRKIKLSGEAIGFKVFIVQPSV